MMPLLLAIGLRPGPARRGWTVHGPRKGNQPEIEGASLPDGSQRLGDTGESES